MDYPGLANASLRPRYMILMIPLPCLLLLPPPIIPILRMKSQKQMTMMSPWEISSTPPPYIPLASRARGHTVECTLAALHARYRNLLLGR